MFAAFGIGPLELLVLLFIGSFCLLLPIGIVVLVVFLVRKPGGDRDDTHR